jgi:hypothetical protein
MKKPEGYRAGVQGNEAVHIATTQARWRRKAAQGAAIEIDNQAKWLLNTTHWIGTLTNGSHGSLAK